jgi:hypothetical protein
MVSYCIALSNPGQEIQNAYQDKNQDQSILIFFLAKPPRRLQLIIQQSNSVTAKYLSKYPSKGFVLNNQGPSNAELPVADV